jgi:hypothetical protein
MGLCSTGKGFAYAVLEGPRRLVGWKLLRLPSRKAPKALRTALRKMQPLFVAFDPRAASKKRSRGRLFRHYVAEACRLDGALLIPIRGLTTRNGRGRRRATRWQIASDVAGQFKELALRLPARRRAWQSEDDRIGIFLALATAIVVWQGFAGM